jgi:hypothetical protein
MSKFVGKCSTCLGFIIINIDDRQIFVRGSIDSAFKTWLCKKKLIPWSWVFRKIQTFPQLITKFPSVYDTRSCVTLFTAHHNLSLSLAICIQSKISNLISPSSTLILFSYLCLFLTIGLSLSGFSTQTLYFLYSNAHSFTKILLHVWIVCLRSLV